MFKSSIAAIMLLLTAGMSAAVQGNPNLAGLDPVRFDTIIGGQQVKLWRLAGTSGIEVCVTNYGARILSVVVPDRMGVMRDVALGYDNVAQLADPNEGKPSFGATVGIGSVPHGGGMMKFQSQTFEPVAESDSSLTLSCAAPDGEAGSPVTLTVTFTVMPSKTLTISYQATTTEPTVVNVTNHTFWNLNADGSCSAMNQLLWLGADYYLPQDASRIPTGEVRPVAGTPFDFKSRLDTISRHLDKGFAPVAQAGGIDHSFVFADGEAHRAVLFSPITGILMDLSTTEPCVRVSTANRLGQMAGKNGVRYVPQNAVCLETQQYPGSVRHAEWPTTVLRPGELFEGQTVYKFRALGFEF